MVKKRIILIAVLAVLMLSVCTPVFASEGVPYDTYIYTMDGNAVRSPHAYVPADAFSSAHTEAGTLNQPTDFIVDEKGNIYISDTGNNRIVVLDKDKNLVGTVSDFEYGSESQKLATPLGIFKSNDERLFVSDSQNNRIVIFDENLVCVDIIESPDSGDIPVDFVFIPSAVSVDSTGMIFVISKGCAYGVVAINPDHSFSGFLGAQRVTTSFADRIWRSFMSKSQRKKLMVVTPANYNNIDIDKNGFIYVTGVVANEQAAAAAIAGRSKDDTFAPVKKLNPEGEDVLTRGGFFPPAGDSRIIFSHQTITEKSLMGPSVIGDISVSESGIYSILDTKRNKVFTYDNDGNLLYIFGGTGAQKGSFSQSAAICYVGKDIMVLDKASGSITRFSMTDYGNLILNAIDLTQNRKYSEAVSIWEKVLLENGGFDMAYKGIGDSLYRDGDYSGAMEYYKTAGDIKGYSKSFGNLRSEKASKMVLLIPLVLAVVVILLSKLMAKVRKYNLNTANKGKKSELLYGFYIIFHPFDGFWDGKREKRTGVFGAAIYLTLAVIAVVVNTIGKGFIFTNPGSSSPNPIIMLVAILAIVLLWCVGNWCLTTLMSGSGKMKDIFIMTGYSLLPIILIYFPSTILSHLLTSEESIFLTLISIIAIAWTAFLLVIGTMTIHEYTAGKNFATVILTIAGMVLIAFVGVLFINLVMKMWKFIENIIQEIQFRI